MARILAVASAKGGVGKTTTTAALGATLAETGKHVVVVDTDLGMANLASALGVDVDGATVHDVLAGHAFVADATYDGPHGLSVVPGDTDLASFPNADPSNLSTLLDGIVEADYVILDTGAGLSHDTVLPLGLADDVVLVTDTDPNAVVDTEKTRQVVDRLGGTVAGVVVTRVDPEMSDDDVRTAVSDVDAPVLAAIPASAAVAATTADDGPHVVSDPRGPVAVAYRQLARELTGESIPDPDPSTAAETNETNSTEDTSESVETSEGDESDEADDVLVPDAELSEEASSDVDDADDTSDTDDTADELTDTPIESSATDDPDDPDEPVDRNAPDAEGVHTTSLVEEAETSDSSAEESSADSEEQSDSGHSERSDSPSVAESENGDDAEDKAERGEEKRRSGLLGRLLG